MPEQPQLKIEAPLWQKPNEEEKNSGEQPRMLEPFKITDWDDVQLKSMKFRKIKHFIRHPYAPKMTGIDLSKLIEVEVEGELKNGVPHGQCFMFFTYKGEL